MTKQEPPDPRIPVTLLTGFLGSGKTTLLNRLLRQPGGKRIAVVVNEFGEVALDHLLIAQSSDNIIELPNGCLCCAVRSDLVTTLFGLYAARVNQTVPPFDRVVIETTGLANPAPILYTLFTDEAVARRFRVDGVVTTVDAVNGLSTLDREAESVHQAAAADLLVITKSDIAARDMLDSLEHRLEGLNPGCPTLVMTDRVDPTVILDVHDRTKADPIDTHQDHDHHDHDHDHHEHHAHHDPRVASYSVIIDEPIAWEDFVRWINALRRLKGPGLLRVKGLANISGRNAGPLVVHAVQEVFHPPVFLDGWPSEDRRTRLVFILREMEMAQIHETLALLQPGDQESGRSAVGGGR